VKRKKITAGGEFFSLIRRMHPFILGYTVVLSFFSGIIYRSDLSLVTKLTVLGAGGLLQLIALSFEAYRIDREEKQRMKVFR
jgi:hypothetical protein